MWKYVGIIEFIQFWEIYSEKQIFIKKVENWEK